MKREGSASPVDVRLRVVALMLEPALALACSMALVGPGLEQRLDSVRHLLGAVGEAVRARFFQPEGSRFSLPRVLSFAASRAALERQAGAMYAAVKEQVSELDAHASDARDPTQAQLVFVVVEKPD